MTRISVDIGQGWTEGVSGSARALLRAVARTYVFYREENISRSITYLPFSRVLRASRLDTQQSGARLALLNVQPCVLVLLKFRRPASGHHTPASPLSARRIIPDARGEWAPLNWVAGAWRRVASTEDRTSSGGIHHDASCSSLALSRRRAIRRAAAGRANVSVVIRA